MSRLEETYEKTAGSEVSPTRQPVPAFRLSHPNVHSGLTEIRRSLEVRGCYRRSGVQEMKIKTPDLLISCSPGLISCSL
jgi:hypothetical protein